MIRLYIVTLFIEFICRVPHVKCWAGFQFQAGIEIAGRNINNLRYANNSTLMAECEEELKRLLMRVKEESGKAGLKLNIQKTKIMASSPITSWHIDGEIMDNSQTLFSWAPKSITVDNDCSHEIKRCLLLGREAMTNLDSTFKSRDVTLPTEVLTGRAIVLAGAVHGRESCTTNKAERQRAGAFTSWCQRIRASWTARSHQSILKKINHA